MTTTRRQDVIAAISALENRHGQLTPDIVLDAAIDPQSPLHSWFEWNDERAGHAYRIDQARSLIRSVRYEVTVGRKQITTVRYVRDVRAEAKEQGYVAVEYVDPSGLAEATVKNEIDRVLVLIARARGIAAALDREDEFLAAIRRAIR